MRINNDIVIEIARDAGFTLVGFAPIELLNKEVDKLDKWLLRGFNSGMDYMERNIEKRRDVKLILEKAKSVISLGMNYYVDDTYENKMGFGKVSRYAWGKDYHLVIWEKLSDIITQLQEIDENFEAKSYVDTGPVMDKAWAVRAGIGWLGKHTNVINPSGGSWFFIANIFTNYEFERNKIIADHCGSCTACIDACPTNAIVEEYVVDANKCISNLTIENRGEIPDQFKNNFDNWLFGCDVCQDVCPWNKKFSIATLLDEFKPDGNKQLNLNEIFAMSNSEFKNRFDTSPIKRARLKGLKRNAKFIE